jgi:hypothetical protein
MAIERVRTIEPNASSLVRVSVGAKSERAAAEDGVRCTG